MPAARPMTNISGQDTCVLPPTPPKHVVITLSMCIMSVWIPYSPVLSFIIISTWFTTLIWGLCACSTPNDEYFGSRHLCFAPHTPQTYCNCIVYVYNVRFDPPYPRPIIYFHFDLVHDPNLGSVCL